MSTHCNLQISQYDASMKVKRLMRSLKDLADSSPTLSGPYMLIMHQEQAMSSDNSTSLSDDQ